jgi:hypothetical protein
MDLMVGYADIAEADWIAAGTGVRILQKNIAIEYVCQPTSKTLYMVPEIKDANTFASGATIKGQIVLRRD